MKKLALAILAGALLLMLYGTAMACPNPDGSCSTNHYLPIGAEEDGHWLRCPECGYEFKENHWGGTATCQKRAQCFWDQKEYGELAPHSFTSKSSGELASAATCTEAAKYYAQCDNCDAVSDTVTVSVGDSLGHDYSGAAATCTEPQICARVGCGAVLDSAKGHDYGGAAATCTTPQICAREGCGAVLASTKGHVEVVDRGIAPTCTATGLTAGKHCDVCGEILVRQTILPMKRHAYQAVTTAATCTEGGYTKYTCANCQASYITNETKARGHHYGEWSFSEDGAHSALCRRTGCEHVRTVECEGFAWRLIAGDAAYDFTLCPVCGAVNDGARLSWVEEAGAEALTENLPRGEIVLRMGTLANGETVMSVGFEYSGALTQPAGEVKVTLPAALLEGYTLALLDADGAETAISTTVEDGTLSFALDFTPVEGEVPAPVRVIHLIPAAESF